MVPERDTVDDTTAAWLADVDGVVADMDGVLWRGSETLPGAAAFLQQLRRDGVPLVLATNNASKPPEAYVERLRRDGFDLRVDEVLTSSIAAATALRRRHPHGTTAYVVGGDGLRQAVASAGLDVVDGSDRQADIVVVGIDFDLTYDKLADATVHIRRGAAFYATNDDPTYPSERGLLPGAGTIVGALRIATETDPVVFGKPGSAMFDIAVERLGVDAARAAMIGDRLDTDVLGARRAGLRSVLVRTGVDAATDLRQADVRPDLVVADLLELRELWCSRHR